MSYSQGNEEAAILEAFGFDPDGHGHGPDKANCRFLDIGAFHASQLSNTRALYELGWSGVLIEPSPMPMHGLIQAYGADPRITLIQAVVSLEGGLVPMHISQDAVSTSEDSQHEKWKASAVYTGKMLVPAITLPQISNQFGGFDFISIDAEGTSVDLFLAALALEWSPRCWAVEHDERLAELLTAATAKGYVATLTNACNVVLVKK